MQNTPEKEYFKQNFQLFGKVVNTQPSQLFDVSSQWKVKLKRKERNKLIEVYVSQSQISKYIYSYDFACFTPFTPVPALIGCDEHWPLLHL